MSRLIRVEDKTKRDDIYEAKKSKIVSFIMTSLWFISKAAKKRTLFNGRPKIKEERVDICLGKYFLLFQKKIIFGAVSNEHALGKLIGPDNVVGRNIKYIRQYT